jgi:hypothetical protein
MRTIKEIDRELEEIHKRLSEITEISSKSPRHPLNLSKELMAEREKLQQRDVELENERKKSYEKMAVREPNRLYRI